MSLMLSPSAAGNRKHVSFSTAVSMFHMDQYHTITIIAKPNTHQKYPDKWHRFVPDPPVLHVAEMHSCEWEEVDLVLFVALLNFLLQYHYYVMCLLSLPHAEQHPGHAHDMSASKQASKQEM